MTVWAALAARSQIAATLMQLVSTRMAAAAVLSPEWAAEVALTTQVHVPIFHRRRLNSEMIFVERASVLDTSAMDCSRRTFSRKP
jgi:hypothetical protein